MPMPSRVSVALCTIEKVSSYLLVTEKWQANSLINQLIEDNRLREIGLVVVVTNSMF